MEDMEGESSVKALKTGNKLAVLGGDYLLANASMALSKLGNVQVWLEFVSQVEINYLYEHVRLSFT